MTSLVSLNLENNFIQIICTQLKRSPPNRWTKNVMYHQELPGVLIITRILRLDFMSIWVVTGATVHSNPTVLKLHFFYGFNQAQVPPYQYTIQNPKISHIFLAPPSIYHPDFKTLRFPCYAIKPATRFLVVVIT